jgi:hypothetical protein
VAEAGAVGLVEARRHRLVEPVLERLARARERDGQGVLLADVAQVERVLHAARLARQALLGQAGEALVLELGQQAGQVVAVDLRQGAK